MIDLLIIQNRVEFYKLLDSIKREHIVKFNEGKNVYIDCFFTDWLAAFLPRFIYAKGLKDENPEYSLIALCDKVEGDVNEIAKGYGIKVISLRKITSFLKGFLTTLFVFLFKNNSKEIYNLSFRGVEIGKNLVDYMIRHTDDLFTVDRIRFKELKHVLKFYWVLYEVDRRFRHAPPDVYLVLEVGYYFGPIIKMAESYGATIIQCLSGAGILEIGKKMDINLNSVDVRACKVNSIVKQMESCAIDYTTWVDEYYNNRRLGLTDRDATAAYSNKVVLTREEWMKNNSSNQNLKNIVIMAHCFSDDANTATSRKIYRDYYEWLLRTLEIIQDIDNVNWLLKAHPARHFYNEGDHIYKILEKYSKKNNIYIIKDDVSSESLYNIVDGAVTVIGTCGLEFSSFGIPVLCAGKAEYGGYGFTMEPLTEEDYIKYLKGMNKIERLSKEKIDVAKKISYAYFNLTKPSDEIDQLFCDSLKMDRKIANDYVIKNLNVFYEKGISDKHSIFYKNAITRNREI